MFNLNYFIGNASLDKEELFERFREILEYIVGLIPTFWHYTLFTIDKNSITVGNFVFALSFLVFGYIVIRIFVAQFDKRVLAHFDVDIPHRYTITTFLFYFLLTFLFLFTLYFIEIPLTVFTFFGGALAIGIGFGARNIMNNLICGIVIVSEHPIRVGDLIEIDRLVGQVEHIGFRATAIRSLDNTHILVPNSVVLEQNILNWTLSDKVIRSDIKVGVSYDSPVEKVRDILLNIARTHEKVLTYNKSQSPVVFFDDFGDSALIFKLNYWIAVNRTIDLKYVASDLRFEVKKRFNEEGIQIAYVQRDLHIKEPIQVELKNHKQS